MLQFFCPGCHAEHKSNEIFAGRRAQCVRCGAAMRIPQTSGMKGVLIPPPSAEEVEPSTDDMDIDAMAEKYGQEATYDEKFIERTAPAEFERSTPRADRRKRQRLFGLLLLVLVAGGIGYFLLNGSPRPKPRAKVVPVTEEEPPPAPPPPLPEPEKPATPPPPPEVPTLINADQLMVEYVANPAACDKKYQDRLLEVQGICRDFGGGRIAFRHMYAVTQELVANEEDGAVTAILPLYSIPAEARFALPAVAGPTAAYTVEPRGGAVAGCGAAVQGRYAGRHQLVNATLVRTMAPADLKYNRQTVSLTGLVLGVTPERLVVESPDTSSRLIFEIYFRPRQDQERLLQVGQIATVTGTCSGRTHDTIRFDNCVIGSGGLATTTAEMIRDYELDLQPGPPIDRSVPPIVVSAEDLAREFQENRLAAMAKYARKYLAVTGTIAANEAATRLVTFEAGTDTALRVVSAFTRVDYARLRADESTIGVKGICYGLTRGRFIRLENSIPYDPDAGNPNIPRLTPDFFPLTAGREWTATRLIEPNPPPTKPDAKPSRKPAKPSTFAVVKLHYKFADDGRLVASLVQQGTTTARTLDELPTATVKWQGKPLKQPKPVLESRYRVSEYAIELGTPLREPPAKPKTPHDLYSWETYLRLGSKTGRDWVSENESNGNRNQTMLTKFFTDSRGRACIQVDATLTNPKQPGVRQVTTMVFTKSVGLVSQRVVIDAAEGARRVLYEERRDDADRGGELQGVPPPVGSRATAPPPREVKLDP